MLEILRRNLSQTHTLQYIGHFLCAHVVVVLPPPNSLEDLNLINKEGVTRNEVFQVFFWQRENGLAGENQLCVGVDKVKAGLVEERSIIHLRVKEELQDIGGVND